MTTQPDIWRLYRQMLRSRLFEETVRMLWEEGLISGEMHLGTGEEAIAAGVVDHLTEEDALALDHRGTPPAIMRGIDPLLLLKEFMGKSDGLCGGNGGHMHIFSKPHRLASSGIVGASGPTAVGFALAAKRLRPGSIVVAFFGDAAINQGMLMESINLAVVWKLPVLFVCKDDSWGITTKSSTTTGGSLRERALGLGAKYAAADGSDIRSTWEVSRQAVLDLRQGGTPVFLHATCMHLDGHFLGYQLLEAVRRPLSQAPRLAAPPVRALARRGGAGIRERLSAMKSVSEALIQTRTERRAEKLHDPVLRSRSDLGASTQRLTVLEEEIRDEISGIAGAALGEDSE